MHRRSPVHPFLIPMILASALALIAVLGPAAPATRADPGDSTDHTINVDLDDTIQEDFLGVGVNLIPSVLMENNRSKGYTEAHWEVDRARIQTLRPSVARVWFQPDWMETEKGSYTFDSDKMTAFYRYLDALEDAGTEVLLNVGWKVGREIQDWFSIPDVDPRFSAPADVEAFGRSVSALVGELVERRGYDNITYVTFYNEPGHGYDFAVPGDARAYYAGMARAVHDQLQDDGRRGLVEIWGPEEWNSPAWTQYMREEAGDVFDAYSFHVYGGTYEDFGNQLARRTSVVAPGRTMLTEFGFSGTWDSWWDAGYAGFLTRVANEGVSAALVWQLNGVWLEDPYEGTDTNDTYTLWDTSILNDAPNPRYSEVGLLTRYIPAHSTVVASSTDSVDLRTAAFVGPTGEYTVLVEANESTAPRSITVDFGDHAVDRTFHRILVDSSTVPEANAALPGASASLEAGTSFTDEEVGPDRTLLIYTTEAPGTQVLIDQPRISLDAGQSIALNAEVVDGAPGVTWSVAGDGNGTVSPEGVYTAPELPEESLVAVRAASTADAAASAVALVRVAPDEQEGRVARPRLSLPQGRYVGAQTVEVESATPGAQIHYTLDGSTPTAGSPVYTEPVQIDATSVLRVVATAEGLADSPLSSALYRIGSVPEAPEDGYVYCGSERQMCAFEGVASVLYGGDGTYLEGVFEDRTRCQVGVFGKDPNPGKSKHCFYRIDSTERAQRPVISPVAGYYEAAQTVTITSPTPDAEIRYTINSTLPTSESRLYTGPFTVGNNATVKAVAVHPTLGASPVAIVQLDVTDKTGAPDGYTWCAPRGGTCTFDGRAVVAYGSSDGATGGYSYGVFEDSVLCAPEQFGGGDPAPNIVKKCFFRTITGEIAAMPVADPPAGTYGEAQNVTLTSTTDTAAIHYTLDGSTPTSESPVHGDPISISRTTTIKAISVADGMEPSPVMSARFVIGTGGGTPDPTEPPDPPEAGLEYCATERQLCDFDGVATVWYGAGETWTTASFEDGVMCQIGTWGFDPVPGSPKYCFARPDETNRVATPTISPDSGDYESPQTVTLATSTDGAEIRYTVNSRLPTAESRLYTGPFTVASNATVKAIALHPNLPESAFAVEQINVVDTSGAPEGFTWCAKAGAPCEFDGEAVVAYGSASADGGGHLYGVFTNSVTCDAAQFGGGDPAPGQTKECFFKPVSGPMASMPQAAPASGTYAGPQTVVLETATAGAVIHFTTDGTAPSAQSPVYTDPLTVTRTTTIRAISVAEGMDHSPMTVAMYTITSPDGSPAPPQDGFTYCASEREQCDFAGAATVLYGGDNSWYSGVFSDGAMCQIGTWGRDPLPGRPKSCFYRADDTERAATPVIVPGAGHYQGPQTISLFSATPGSEIRYTINSLLPTAESRLYTGPFTVSSNATIKAVAIHPDLADSPYEVAQVNVEAVPAGAPRATTRPSISGVASVTGLVEASPGVWEPEDASFSYQWTSDGQPIPGATSGSLAVTPDLAGRVLSVTVAASVTGAPEGFAASPPVVIPEVADWTAGAVYGAGDVVLHGGRVFEALWWTQHQEPGTSSWLAWAEIGQTVGCPSHLRQWASSAVYTNGQKVVHDDRIWIAQWWTRDQEPGLENGPWQDAGACARQ